MEPHEEVLLMLQSILDCTLDHPENCTVKGTVTDTGTDFVILPAPSDVGKVVGRAGRTARSIRILLGAASANHRTKYSLNIQEPTCVHCGCTQNNACRTTMGNCHWVSDFLPRAVCSGRECIEKEIAAKEAA